MNMQVLDVNQLRKDIETIGEWRSLGKAFTREQQVFAERVVDRMLEAKNAHKMGVHLIGKDKLSFIQKYEGRDATSDETSYGAKKVGEDARVSAGVSDVAKVAIKSPKAKEMPISAADSGKDLKQAPDVVNTKLTPPDNQAEGEVSSIADAEGKSESKATSEDVKPTKDSAEIGHNPNEPMPKKMAEDLLGNAKWGVEIGAYTTLEEGIDKQLSRKAYAEFTDTPEKLTAVKAYLKTVGKEQTDPKEMIAEAPIQKAEKTKTQLMLASNKDRLNGKVADNDAAAFGEDNPEGVDKQKEISIKLTEEKYAQAKLSSKDYQDYLHARKQGLTHENAMKWALQHDVGEAKKEKA